MTFTEFRIANVTRCERSFHMCNDWTPTDWACALAGEVGEACNLVKKLRRGEAIPAQQIAKELADVITYCDLLAKRLDIDLESAVIDKFNEVSECVGSNIRL